MKVSVKGSWTPTLCTPHSAVPPALCLLLQATGAGAQASEHQIRFCFEELNPCPVRKPSGRTGPGAAAAVSLLFSPTTVHISPHCAPAASLLQAHPSTHTAKLSSLMGNMLPNCNTEYVEHINAFLKVIIWHKKKIHKIAQLQSITQCVEVTILS